MLATGLSAEEAIVFDRVIVGIINDDPDYIKVSHRNVYIKNEYFTLQLKINLAELHTRLKQMAKKLVARHVVSLKDSTSSTFEVVGLFSRVTISKEGLLIEVNENCIPSFMDMAKKYKPERLRYLLRFNSNHPFKLYLYLSEHGNLIIDIEKLKELLDLDGKYQRYSSFKNDVLLTAIAEINAKSDIEIEFKELFAGRKIIGLAFNVTPKTLN